jgi:hypothetical protein
MKRSTILLGGAASILIAAAVAIGQDRPVRPMNTLKLMNQIVPDVSFIDQPFESVMRWVESYSGANVLVKWEILEAAGLDRTKSITLRANGLRLSQVLWLALNSAGGTDLILAYRASGSMIVISTKEDLGKEMLTRVYDVSDLLLTIPRFSGESQLDASQALNAGGGGGGGLFSGGTENTLEDEDGGDGIAGGPNMQRLIEIITMTVEPDSWAQNGGNGTVQSFRNLLVIRNTIAVHQQIAGYVSED